MAAPNTLIGLCEALGGEWYATSDYGMAPCPVCQREGRRDQRSMRLKYGERDGKVIFSCWKNSCRYPEITAILKFNKLWPMRALTPAELLALKQRAAERADANKSRAREVWNLAKPIDGTLAERYLRCRGIDCPMPTTLRFLGGAWHAPSSGSYPAMIAKVIGPAGLAVHRTFLDVLNHRKANVEPNKMMLSSTQGGAVVLSNGSPKVLGVGEGIESSLSLSSGHLAQRFGPMTVVAALSAGGMGSLALPQAPTGGQLVIASDGDIAGAEGASKLTLHAVTLGWQVHQAPAPKGFDWNDVLQGKAQ